MKAPNFPTLALTAALAAAPAAPQAQAQESTPTQEAMESEFIDGIRILERTRLNSAVGDVYTVQFEGGDTMQAVTGDQIESMRASNRRVQECQDGVAQACMEQCENLLVLDDPDHEDRNQTVSAALDILNERGIPTSLTQNEAETLGMIHVSNSDLISFDLDGVPEVTGEAQAYIVDNRIGEACFGTQYEFIEPTGLDLSLQEGQGNQMKVFKTYFDDEPLASELETETKDRNTGDDSGRFSILSSLKSVE